MTVKSGIAEVYIVFLTEIGHKIVGNKRKEVLAAVAEIPDTVGVIGSVDRIVIAYAYYDNI